VLGRQDVEQVALLARLELSPGEIDAACRELEGILAHIDKLKALDTTGVEPTTHALPVVCPLRADGVGEQLQQQEALSDAPGALDGCFEVPRIIGGAA
jgi:aspartyl-tRNA(Asn)/glutamyl-tRNA(Gln) amidotransferase subunit C